MAKYQSFKKQMLELRRIVQKGCESESVGCSALNQLKCQQQQDLAIIVCGSESKLVGCSAQSEH